MENWMKKEIKQKIDEVEDLKFLKRIFIIVRNHIEKENESEERSDGKDKSIL